MEKSYSQIQQGRRVEGHGESSYHHEEEEEEEGGLSTFDVIYLLRLGTKKSWTVFLGGVSAVNAVHVQICLVLRSFFIMCTHLERPVFILVSCHVHKDGTCRAI